MIPFNHTFTSSKPIIFPSNWHTGKTQQQLNDQWKTTLEFAIYSNILQILAASLLIIVIVAFILAIRELVRISKLQEGTIEQISNKKYLKPSFLLPLGFLGLFCIALLGLLLSQQWTRMALLKGFAFCLFCYIAYRGYKVLTIFLKQLKIAKNKKIKQQSQKPESSKE